MKASAGQQRSARERCLLSGNALLIARRLRADAHGQGAAMHANQPATNQVSSAAGRRADDSCRQRLAARFHRAAPSGRAVRNHGAHCHVRYYVGRNGAFKSHFQPITIVSPFSNGFFFVRLSVPLNFHINRATQFALMLRNLFILLYLIGRSCWLGYVTIVKLGWVRLG